MATVVRALPQVGVFRCLRWLQFSRDASFRVMDETSRLQVIRAFFLLTLSVPTLAVSAEVTCRITENGREQCCKGWKVAYLRTTSSTPFQLEADTHASMERKLEGHRATERRLCQYFKSAEHCGIRYGPLQCERIYHCSTETTGCLVVEGRQVCAEQKLCRSAGKEPTFRFRIDPSQNRVVAPPPG